MDEGRIVLNIMVSRMGMRVHPTAKNAGREEGNMIEEEEEEEPKMTGVVKEGEE